MWSSTFNFFLCILVVIYTSLSGCGGGSESNPVSPEPLSKSGPKSPEFQIVERFIDSTESATYLEGVWESACISSGIDASYRKATYTFHLNGYYFVSPVFSDSNCRIRGSQKPYVRYGIVKKIEPVTLYNGSENITVQEVTIQLMKESRNRYLTLEEVSLDKLVDDKIQIMAYKIVENRLYSTDDYGPSSYNMLTNEIGYLTNTESDNNGLSEEDVDIKAEQLFGVL
ncbi:MAG: hypothetical protein OEX07_07095 [Gammaproteobacteria bacterium]|nr:hypothetical protein [Gammaproteobacteria bacterium]